ncbi:MAG: hypothetical protein LQ352_000490 [Teloschistes flavicans]|nr:MAG: hypothetical protein LQ352_000490 [Teloschistes flavicans]
MQFLAKAAVLAGMLAVKAAFAAPVEDHSACLPNNVLYSGINFPYGIPDSACCSGHSAGHYCVSGPIERIEPPETLPPGPTPPEPTTAPPPPPPPAPSSSTCDEACHTTIPLPLLSPPNPSNSADLLPPASTGGKGAEAVDPTSRVPAPVQESSVIPISTHVPIPVQESSDVHITTHVPIPGQESSVFPTPHIPIPVTAEHSLSAEQASHHSRHFGPGWSHTVTHGPVITPFPHVPIPVSAGHPWSAKHHSNHSHHFGPGWSHTLAHQPLTTLLTHVPIPVSAEHSLSAEQHSRSHHFGPGWSHTIAHQPLTTPTPTTLATKVVKARDEQSTYTFPQPRIPIPVSALPGHHHDGQGLPHTLNVVPGITPTKMMEARDGEPTYTLPRPRIPIPVSDGHHFGPGWAHTIAVEPLPTTEA